MGNHEFCVDCGASCFHNNDECNPEVKAAYQAEIKKAERKSTMAKQLAKFHCDVLRKDGYETEIDRYGNIVIPWYSFRKDLD